MTTFIPFGLTEGDRDQGLQSIEAAAVPRTHALRQGDSVFIVLDDAALCVHSESGRHVPDQVLPLRDLLGITPDKPQVRPPSPWLAWLKVVPFLIWNWRDVIKAFLPENLDDRS